MADHDDDLPAEVSGPMRMCAHPLAMVLTALDGVTDPKLLGVEPDSDAAAALAALDAGGRP